MSIYYKGKRLSLANHHVVNYEGAIEGVTVDDNKLIIDDSPYQYVYVNQQGNVYIQQNTLLDVEASTYIRRVANGVTVTATNLSPENIKKGVTILGVTGTYEGE